MELTLTVDSSRPTGSRNAGRLRREGKIPGVVYGLGSDPTPIVIPWPDLRKVLTTDAGMNALIELTVDGRTNLSVVKDLQRHPVRRDVLHVDFMLIDRDAPLEVDVPLVLVGSSSKLDAVKGMVDQLLYNLTIKARPGTIPTSIECDISHLDVGDQFRVGDITLPGDITTDVDPETAIAQGAASRATIILQQGEGAEGAEGEGGEGGDEGGDGGGADASE